METTFAQNPEFLGVGGVIVADGARTIGIRPAEALEIIEEYERKSATSVTQIMRRRELLGGLMAFRSDVFDKYMFDERLVLYGWLEDKDFCRRVSTAGELVVVRDLIGVHLGLKSGKVPGTCLGISQVINPLYLWRKGTLRFGEACTFIIRCFAANLFKSIWSEVYIDRRGRLWGNFLGIGYVACGKLNPAVVGRAG
jgi:GT2 family glycosyltransferase